MSSLSKSNVSVGSSENRWDPDILNEFECKNVFTDQADEHLPEFFDPDQITKKKSEVCMLC
jgi:hypothetical protein